MPSTSSGPASLRAARRTSPSATWRPSGPSARTVTRAAPRTPAGAADGFDLEGRNQALVCGIEAHVCVKETVLDLLDAGVDVQVVTDGVGSRSERDRELGLHRAERAGAVLTSVETALFELLRGSDA